MVVERGSDDTSMPVLNARNLHIHVCYPPPQVCPSECAPPSKHSGISIVTASFRAVVALFTSATHLRPCYVEIRFVRETVKC